MLVIIAKIYFITFEGVLLKKILCFVGLIFLMCFALYSQQVTEYTYIFEKNREIVIDDFEEKKESEYTILAENSVDMTVLRRDMPLVNRMIRFVSATPDIFTFEDNQQSIIEVTDQNGTALAPVEIREFGRGIAIVQLLYVGANVAVTNITHEEYITLNIAEEIIDINTDEEDIAENNISLIRKIFPFYLLLIITSFLIIGYFKRLKRDEGYNKISKYMMGSLFGFSSVRKERIFIMIPFFLIEVLIFYITIFRNEPIVPTMLLLFAMVTYRVRHDRAYSALFMLFAMISIVHYASVLLFGNASLVLLEGRIAILDKWYFLVPFFIIITSFLSGLYIPLVILSFMQILFSLSFMNVVFAMIGITLSFILFIILKMLNINTYVFFKLNMLKVRV